jgi:CRP/FNR family transcriptional regulator, polysaccharide utilization system transcription regulator
MLNQISIYGHFIKKPILADDLFSDLSIETRQTLTSLIQTKVIPKEETVIQIGSFPSFIYLLQKGRAEIIYKNELSRKDQRRIVEKKEIIGLRQLFIDEPCELSLKTLSSCQFEIIKNTEFIAFLKDEPSVCFRLFDLFGLDIQQSYEDFLNSKY